MQCFCGGGGERTPTVSAAPTEAPLPTPGPTAFEIDPNCTDYEGFEDAYGDGCEWYAEFDDPGCPVEGETLGGDGFEDVSASEACVSSVRPPLRSFMKAFPHVLQYSNNVNSVYAVEEESEVQLRPLDPPRLPHPKLHCGDPIAKISLDGKIPTKMDAIGIR